jgi:hypothetical protein
MPTQTQNTNFFRALSFIRQPVPAANPLALPSSTKTGNVWSAEYTQLRVPVSAGERVSWSVLSGATDYYFSITKTAAISSNVRISIFEGSGVNGPMLGAFNGGASTYFSFQSRPGQTITFVAQVNASGLGTAETFDVNIIPAIPLSTTMPASGQIAYYNHSNGGSGQFWARGLSDGYPLRNPTTANVQVFTANGTWTKPPNVTWVRAFMVGGGQGGGSGATGATTGTKLGGQGGNGGAVINYYSFLASALGSTVAVTVGAGGAGAPGTSTSNAARVNGGSGGSSTFGSLTASGATTIAPSGDFTASNQRVGSRLIAFNSSQGGAGASLVDTTPAGGESPLAIPCATSPATSVTSGIPFYGSNTPSEVVPPGATSESSQLASVDGRPGVGFGNLLPIGGSGGSGGGIKSDLTYFGNGGAGGLYGGGGGGGAAALNGSTSGSGGTGGPGIVVIMAW